jgi:hypothetical protein
MGRTISKYVDIDVDVEIEYEDIENYIEDEAFKRELELIIAAAKKQLDKKNKNEVHISPKVYVGGLLLKVSILNYGIYYALLEILESLGLKFEIEEEV